MLRLLALFLNATGLMVCVRGIVDGPLTVGDAVLFLSLMNQLVAPLSFFGRQA
jgi:ATP-binding cassette subfamily B (MDR/TAP) protein 6